MQAGARGQLVERTSRPACLSSGFWSAALVLWARSAPPILVPPVAMADQYVSVEKSGRGWARITLQRESTNAMDVTMWQQLASALEACEQAVDVRGVIFCRCGGGWAGGLRVLRKRGGGAGCTRALRPCTLHGHPWDRGLQQAA